MPKRFHPIYSHIEIPSEESWTDTSRPGYQVSTHGRVRRRGLWHFQTTIRNGKTLSYVRRYKDGLLSLKGRRYVRVELGKGYPKNVHRLVLESFVGPCPEGMQCRHLNGDPLDNRLENLAWGSPLENQRDRARHGTSPRITSAKGEDCSWSKLTTKDIKKIRMLYSDRRYSQSKLAVMYGVHQVTISEIVTRKIWKHV